MTRESKDIKIVCAFVRKRNDGSAICIQDGSSSPDPLHPNKRYANEFWIRVKDINDSDYSSINDLHRGQRIEIFIPEWLALEKGLI